MLIIAFFTFINHCTKQIIIIIIIIISSSSSSSSSSSTLLDNITLFIAAKTD
jgi:hypothetical protein